MSKKNVENKLTVKVETRGMRETSELLGSINKQLYTTQTRGLKITELIDSTADALEKIKIPKGLELLSVTKDIKSSINELGKIPSEITNTFKENIKQIDKAIGTASTISKVSTKDVNKSVKSAQTVSSGFANAVNANSSVDNETIKKGFDINKIIGQYHKNIEKLSQDNIDPAIYKLFKFITYATETLEVFNAVDEENVNAMSKLGSSVTSTANGLTKLSKLTEEEYQLGVKRAIDASNQRAQAAYETNKQIHAQSVKDNRHWFDNLFDKSKSKKDRFKESGGLLLGDIKNTMVNGLKGLITGGIFNLAIKGITSLIKLALTPLKTIFKLGTSFAKTMLRTATSTETFKKLMELVVMPFTLLFTLMFAPILVKLAPLLVDMVQKVTEKWDVLEGIGNKIAEVLTLFFDDNNWFSFGNVLDWIIETLDELATIAYNTFQQCKEAGDTGLGALVAVAANLIIKLTDKIIEFVMSPDGLYLFWAVGEIVGLLLVEALKIVIVAIGPTIVSVLGILGGIIATCFIEIIRGVARVIEQTITAFGIGSLFAGMINDVADEMDSKFTGDNLKSNLESKLTEQGLYGSNTSTINNINYQTTNFNQYKGSLYATSGKQLSMGGW